MILSVNIIIIAVLTTYYYYKYPFGVNFFFNLGAFFYFVPNLLNYEIGINSLNISSYTFYSYNYSIFIFVVTWNVFGVYFNSLSRSIELPSIRINAKLCLIVFVAFLVVFFVGIIGSVGVKNYFTMNRAYFYEIKSSIPSFLEIFLNFSVVIYFIIISKKLKTNKKYKRNITFFILLIFIVLFPTGARGKILSILIGIVYLLVYYNKMSEKKLIAPAVLCGVFFQLFGKVRHLTSDPVLIFSFLIENFSWKMFDLSQGESQANFNVYDKIFNDGNVYLYGHFFQTVFDSFQLLIPGFLYNRSFDGLNTWFVENYYPETYLKGGGKAFSILAEGMMNGGYFGVFIITSLTSVSLILAAVFVEYFMGKQYVLILYVGLLFDIFQLPRLYYGSFLKQVVIMVFVPLIFVYLANYVLKKRY